MLTALDAGVTGLSFAGEAIGASSGVFFVSTVVFEAIPEEIEPCACFGGSATAAGGFPKAEVAVGVDEGRPKLIGAAEVVVGSPNAGAEVEGGLETLPPNKLAGGGVVIGWLNLISGLAGVEAANPVLAGMLAGFGIGVAGICGAAAAEEPGGTAIVPGLIPADVNFSAGFVSCEKEKISKGI